jgi:iron-sulfur cluster assembly protein
MQLSLTLSTKAIKEIKYLLEFKELDDTYGIRVGVKGGGCSGYTYNLEFGKKHDSDVFMEQDGINIFTDPKSVSYINGTTLDYTDGLQGKGFSFENPNATQTCGCGESFSV